MRLLVLLLLTAHQAARSAVERVVGRLFKSRVSSHHGGRSVGRTNTIIPLALHPFSA